MFLFLEAGKGNRRQCKVMVNRDFTEAVVLPGHFRAPVAVNEY
jgi:hypothetical protein